MDGFILRFDNVYYIFSILSMCSGLLHTAACQADRVSVGEEGIMWLPDADHNFVVLHTHKLRFGADAEDCGRGGGRASTEQGSRHIKYKLVLW